MELHPKKKRATQTLATIWKANHGTPLLIIGFAVIVVGSALISVQRFVAAGRIPPPDTVGQDLYPSNENQLNVVISGFESDTGNCCIQLHRMTSSEEKPIFQLQESQTVRIESMRVVWNKQNPLMGDYIVRSYHDADGNGDYTDGEKLGFSNEATGAWNQPLSKSAGLRYESGRLAIPIILRSP